MGDSHVRKTGIYLPPSYDPMRSDPYPVLFFLAGWGSRSSKFLSNDSAFDRPLDQRIDTAISSGVLPPFIGVFPDGTSRLGCNQYINSPSLGMMSDHLCNELIDYIDHHFHTHRSSKFRAILGHSSGGYGALVNGFIRSDAFKFVCSSAGDSFFDLLYRSTIVGAQIEVSKAGGIEQFINDFFAHPNPGSQSRSKSEALLTLSAAPCYAPNLKASPLFGDLYFDLKTGVIIPEVFEKYLAWDPVRCVDSHKKSAQELKFVLLESGLQDEYGLHLGHRLIAEKLTRLKIPHEVVEYPGGHSGHHHRFVDRAQKLIQRMMDKSTG